MIGDADAGAFRARSAPSDPGAATPDEVVADAIAHLSNGPTWLVGEQLRDGARHLGALTRSDAATIASTIARPRARVVSARRRSASVCRRYTVI